MSLPRAAAWKAGFGGATGIWDFISQEGGPALALAYAELFVPRFIEVEGCIVLAERYEPANFAEWQRSTGGDRKAIEAVLNHVHLWDIFDTDQEAVPDDALRQLARTLALTWRAALADQFPDRIFDVRVTDEPESYGPTVTVTSAP